MNNKLERFIEAQEKSYEEALKEIKNGRKETHWMWYIFPQITGLGMTYISNYYSIKSIEEAEEYLKNKQLRTNLEEITKELLKLKTNDSEQVLGPIDSLKLKSSMTLFDYIEPDTIYNLVLQKYYSGEKDNKTLEILSKMSKEKVNIIRRNQ